jgi:predicted DNA-binding transcriptional regulator AlpA
MGMKFMKTILLNQTGSVTDVFSARKFSKAKAVAQRLGVCPRTIFRWANAGMIARHKINARVVLFDEAEVIALIEAARVESG